MTDETAQAILDAETFFDIQQALDTSEDYYVTYQDLQRMAKFWLLKDEIEHAVRLVATVSIPHRDLFAKIEALEAE